MKNTRIYYAINPNCASYRWITRGPEDYYIMMHKNDVSKSRLDGHSFYYTMKFTEITVQATKDWANHVIDNRTWISQNDYENRNKIHEKLKQSIGRLISSQHTKGTAYDLGDILKPATVQYLEGQIIIAKEKSTQSYAWIFKLGSKSREKDRFNLTCGFKIGEFEVYSKLSSQAFAETKDIVRHATVEEVRWFNDCILNNRQTPRPCNTTPIDRSESNEPKGMISFEVNKKQKQKQKSKTSKPKLSINKIKTYEY